MRHRLFHAVVLAALPGCGSSSPPVTPDVPADAAVGEVAADAAVDTARAETAAVDAAIDTSEPETCVDGCGKDCLPCIK